MTYLPPVDDSDLSLAEQEHQEYARDSEQEARDEFADIPQPEPSAPALRASSRAESAVPDGAAANRDGIIAALEGAYACLDVALTGIQHLPGEHILLVSEVVRARSLSDYALRKVQTEA